MPWVLPPLLRATDHVLVVDNGSTDGTPEVTRETAERAGLAHKLRQASYPFSVARAGAEHLAQPERSVHSLAYFYNWCFAQVTTRYSWKWDGDMVLTTEGEASIGDLGWQVGDVQSIIRVPRRIWRRAWASASKPPAWSATSTPLGPRIPLRMEI